MSQVSSFQISVFIFGILCALILSTGIGYDCLIKIIRSRDAINVTRQQEKRDIPLVLITYLNVISLLLHLLTVLARFMFANSDMFCLFIAKIGLNLFITNRWSMYLIFIRRIAVSFKHSIFELNKYHALILYIFVTSYWIPYVCYVNWFAVKSVYNPELKVCDTTYHQLCTLIAYVIDIFLSIYTLCLFIIPLKRHTNYIKETGNNQNSRRLYHIMVKYAILGSITIISSLILFTMAVFSEWGMYWSVLDDTINGICILLIHAIHNNIYMVLCKYCHNCCFRNCNGDIDHNRSDENMGNKGDNGNDDNDNDIKVTVTDNGETDNGENGEQVID